MSGFVESARRHDLALLSPRSLRQTRAVVRFGRMTLIALAVLGVYAAGRGTSPDGLLCVALLAGVWLLALDVGRASAPDALGPYVGTAVGGLVGLVVVPGVAMWIPFVELSPARSLVMAAAVLVAVSVWETLVHRTTAARRRVLVVGPTAVAEAVAAETSGAATQVDVIGVVPERDADADGGSIPVVGEPDALAEVVEALSPDVVVVDDGMDVDTTVDRLLDVSDDGFRIVGFTSFFEHVSGRVPVSTLRASWFMSLLHLRRRPYLQWAKRAFDVVVATVGLLVTAPLMVLVALLLWPSGSVLYRQTRLGQHGRCFTIFKFRTMRVDAEAPGEAVWSSEADPRVTRLGRALRRAHVDELPQLLSVLRGDMSMVGPRPERPEFVELLEREVPFWNRRLLVKPGVTGWAQLKGGYASDTEDMAQKLSYDLWYLRNSNVLVDLAICVATALQLLVGAPRRATTARVGPGTRGGEVTLRAHRRARGEARNAPSSAPTTSKTRSMNAASRPATNAWWSSSVAPYSTAATTLAANERLPRRSSPASTAYSPMCNTDPVSVTPPVEPPVGMADSTKISAAQAAAATSQPRPLPAVRTPSRERSIAT